MKCVLKCQTLKVPKLAQLDKMLCKWFTPIGSIRKPLTGPMTIEKAKSCNEMQIIDKCTFSDDWLQIVREHHGNRRLGTNGYV